MSSIIFLGSGILLLVGAYCRWRWLVDPPVEWSSYYSQALLRHVAGKTFTLYFTYFWGLLFTIAGGMGTYEHREQLLALLNAHVLR